MSRVPDHVPQNTPDIPDQPKEGGEKRVRERKEKRMRERENKQKRERVKAGKKDSHVEQDRQTMHREPEAPS